MEQLIKQYNLQLNNKLKKYQSLRDLDLFVLDNSIRESTVGQLRGHTSEDKWRIFDEVKKCGFTNAIVASLTDDVSVDDDFLEELVMNAEDTTGLYVFSEITRNVTNGIPNTSRLPIGLEKLKRVGMRNVILESDLGDGKYDFNKFSTDKMCNLLLKLVTWCHDNLHKNSRVLVNFRDMPNAMSSDPERVFRVVEFLAKLPPRLRLFGILYEDPGGQCVAEEFSTWARFVRTIMDANKWNGHLLVHVHEKFCLGDVTVLEALMNGANGIWASVCHEGAPVGHAASIVTLINMIRHGNRHVVRRYNCEYLREAAINVTNITTGHDPPTNHPIYGERALDCVLNLRRDEFDLAKFFNEKAPVRISSISSGRMICKRLIDVFGQDEQFTLELADKMKMQMLHDLRTQRKEEYMSKHGLSILFRRSGGSLTQTMRATLVDDVQRTPHSRRLLKDIRTLWDSCFSRCHYSNNAFLPYDVFYVNFMQPYFAYYRSVDTRSALNALDFDSDGNINWEDFLVYLTWALREYPDTGSVHDVIDIVFMKRLTPTMRAELGKPERTEIRILDKENRISKLKNSEQYSGLSNRSSSSQKQFSKTTPFLPKIRIRRK